MSVYASSRTGMLFHGELFQIKNAVRSDARRVATLGQWPERIDPNKALVDRVPSLDRGAKASGFDAGIACSLGLIPRDKQKLAAVLHAAYTPEAVEQVRREAEDMDPDSETCWWLAACAVCREGEVDAMQFFGQLEAFHVIMESPELRRKMAMIALTEMSESFETSTYLAPFGTKDGCMQGAYVAGHDFATQYAEAYGIYLIGTYLPSLGLEEFPWSDEKDDKGRPKSGPVHGSTQFVKCCDEDEFREALVVVRRCISV